MSELTTKQRIAADIRTFVAKHPTIQKCQFAFVDLDLDDNDRPVPVAVCALGAAIFDDLTPEQQVDYLEYQPAIRAKYDDDTGVISDVITLNNKYEDYSFEEMIAILEQADVEPEV